MRLIDADNVAFEFKRMLDNVDERNAKPDQKEEFTIIRTYIEWARYVVECAPIVDAVEVVRCKDCKHYCPVYADTMGGRDCLLLKTITRANDFCSYGERKNEDEAN